VSSADDSPAYRDASEAGQDRNAPDDQQTRVNAASEDGAHAALLKKSPGRYGRIIQPGVRLTAGAYDSICAVPDRLRFKRHESVVSL